MAVTLFFAASSHVIWRRLLLNLGLLILIELPGLLQFVPSGLVKTREELKMNPSILIKGRHARVQDKELLEMSDTGACLSLHQPWASLLVYGIKKHEGRTWYSHHRGRLWIAAAAKPCSEDEIKETEKFHRMLRAGEDVSFPKHYPLGCLLGCVNIVDCLSQEEYQTRYERPESDSPFVFICKDAQAFHLKFPVSGKHKIYQLEKDIHNAAQKMLLRLLKENAQR